MLKTWKDIIYASCLRCADPSTGVVSVHDIIAREMSIILENKETTSKNPESLVFRTMRNLSSEKYLVKLSSILYKIKKDEHLFPLFLPENDRIESDVSDNGINTSILYTDMEIEVANSLATLSDFIVI